MPLESHAVSKLSIWALLAVLAAESSQEMQILLFVIARLVNLQDRVMFLVFRLMNHDFNSTLCFLLINYDGNEPSIE